MTTKRQKLIGIVIDDQTLNLLKYYQRKLKHRSGHTYKYNDIMKAMLKTMKAMLKI